MIPSKNILIAEDETMTLDTLAFILEQEGHKVITVENGLDAYNAILANHGTDNEIELLITDLQMARMNGLQLIEKLSELDFYIPTLVITGFGDKATIIELLRKGCTNYIDKPFKPDEFLSRVREVFEKDKKRQEEMQRNTFLVTRDMEIYKNSSQGYKKILDETKKSYDAMFRLNLEEYSLPMVYQTLPLNGIGGDFVLTRETEQGIAIFLGDMAGHEMKHALFTLVIKGFFEGYTDDLSDPIQFFNRLYKKLEHDNNRAIPFTGILLSFDFKLSKAFLFSLAHPMPVIVTGDRIEIEASWESLGECLDGHQLQGCDIDLKAGQRFFLFTDGITSASCFDKGECRKKKLGMDGLLNLIEKNLDRNIDDLVEQIFLDVLIYCNHKASDDMLLFGIEIPLDFHKIIKGR